MSHPPTVPQFIERAGDGKKLAAALEPYLPADERPLEAATVYKWKELKSIPVRLRLHVARMALDLGLPLPSQLAEYGALLKSAQSSSPSDPSEHKRAL